MVGQDPDPAVGGVGDEDVAAAVDRHPGRLVELAGRAGQAVAVEAGRAGAGDGDQDGRRAGPTPVTAAP